MAGFSQDGGLNVLFEQMRQRNSSAPHSTPSPAQRNTSSASHLQPTVSSPLPTPPVANQPPQHPSAIMSPAGEYPPSVRQVSAGSNNTAHTASLLNLLKFSGPTSMSPVTQPPPSQRATSSSVPANSGAADLLATLMGTVPARKENEDLSARLRADVEKVARDEEAAKAPSADTQNFLLQLLNRPKTSDVSGGSATKSSYTASISSPALETQPVPKSVDLSPVQNRAQALGDHRSTNESYSTPRTASSVRDDTMRSTSNNQTKQQSSASTTVPQGLFTYVNPFEQLAASSPRNRTPKPTTPTPASALNTQPMMQILRRKAEDSEPSKSPSISSAQQPTAPVHSPAGTATVTDAVAELSSQVDKQVEEAIARAENRSENTAEIEKDLRTMLDARNKNEFEASAQVAASAIKEELAKPGNEGVLNEALPASVAEAVKDIVDEVAQGHMPDSWENDDTLSQKNEDGIKVYTFPMKPWISIDIIGQGHDICTFKDADIFDIARLKKEFDQVDRTLVTASAGFLVYGMPKNGGIRAIRQSDGRDMKLFNESKDRVFNLSISTAKDSEAESAIGTGVSGSVYWVDLKAAEADIIEDGQTSSKRHGFAFPAIQSPGEESSGGMLKTRARTSSSHPAFFAISRGKLIHIVWPSIITKRNYFKAGKDDYQVVDTEKYLQNHSLKINTGKAGKDFNFSQDDTTIVSLDKAGRVKFWDVRALTNTGIHVESNQAPEIIQPVEVQEPIMFFDTTRENTKAWPTSVMFIDSGRPYKKGGPLRYLLVGMKQNHTIQLWDLTLKRAVQEVVLPHEKESDAVCSITYHPATGIIAIGHPTRNSIYFIHVSCPKYDAPKNSSQAEFMQQIVNRSALDRPPSSTAVMSGVREYSLGSKGQLRSLDMLLTPASSSENDENPVLFELYMMHSKGVTYTVVKREDMGWGSDNKNTNPHDAVLEGLVAVSPLKEATNYETSPKLESKKPTQAEIKSEEVVPAASVESARTTLQQTKPTASRTPSPTKNVRSERPTPSAAIDDNAPIADKLATSTSTDKNSKNKKKKSQSSTASKEPVNGTSASAGSAKMVSRTMDETSAPAPSVPAIPEDAITSVVNRVGSSVSSEIAKTLSTSFDTLYKNIKDDRRAQSAQHGANQEALIKIVATTLEENVGRKLEGIIGESMTRSVIPAINNGITTNVVPAVTQVAKSAITHAINEQLSSHLSSHLNSQVQQAVGKELRSVLPDAITKSLHQAEVLRLMSESLAKGVAFKVEEQFAIVMRDSIAPTFTNLAIQAAQQATAEVQRQASERLEQQALEYNNKIDKLTQVVSRLIETTSAVEHSQAKLSEQYIKSQQAQQAVVRESVARQSTPQQHVPAQQHVGNNSRQVSARGPQHSQQIQQPPPSMQQMQPQTRPQQVQQSVRAPEPEASELERALSAIAQDMVDNRFEQACMHWLQFDNRTKQDMFVKYFSQIDPSFVAELSDLMLLSLSSVVSDEFEGQTFLARLRYLETVLDEYSHRNVADPQIVEVVPRIMSLVIQRSEIIFARISSVAPQDQSLQRLLVVMQSAKRISDTSNSWQSSHDGW